MTENVYCQMREKMRNIHTRKRWTGEESRNKTVH